jgi:predicted nucleic acid-binding protein
MTGRSFVDTSVWVYAADRGEPDKRARARALLAAGAELDAVLSAQVLGEFFVTVTRKLAPPVPLDRAVRIVDRMSQLPVVPLDARLVSAAVAGTKEWGISYWDALIVAAAEAGGCDRVLSEDLADGAIYGSVRVENPFADLSAETGR